MKLIIFKINYQSKQFQTNLITKQNKTKHQNLHFAKQHFVFQFCNSKQKRKYQLGRPSAMTKLGSKRVRLVRTRGGNTKFRALSLETGNFSWGSETVARKTRIINCVYNAANNEFVRTNTLVKGAIVQIDATPFKQFYEQHYGVGLGGKKGKKKVCI